MTPAITGPWFIPDQEHMKTLKALRMDETQNYLPYEFTQSVSKKKKKKKGSKHWYTYYILLRDEWKWKVPIPPQPPQLLPLAWYYFKPFSKYPDCQKCCSAPLVHTCTQGRQLGPHRSRAATGGSLMKRSGPVWKQRGCAVAQTHGTELMETPPLCSSPARCALHRQDEGIELRPHSRSCCLGCPDLHRSTDSRFLLRSALPWLHS